MKEPSLTKMPAASIKGVTLRQVADLAQVSAMSVSNYMNGRFGAMSEDTRARIGEAVAQLNYRPNSAGRGLRTSAGRLIGMILVNDSPTFLADPFITQVVAGLSNYLNQHGYGLVLEGLTRQGFLNSPLIRDLRTDAFSVMLSGRDLERRAILDTLVSLHQPIVLFQERPPHGAADLCAIRQDDRNGGRMLAEHLLQLGVRRILFLAPALTWPAISQRLRGIRQALAATKGSATLEVVLCGDGSFSAAETPLAAYVDANGFPDAIMGGNDQLGIAGLKIAKAHGRKIPEDMLVTGFNAFEFGATQTRY
jgi:DNA-binding LacI/PurR family transcriptional regulator